MSISIFGVPVPSGMIQCCNGNFSAAMVALVVRSAHSVGMALGVLRVLRYCPPPVESNEVVL